jgi:DNA-binding GntR family transcriptional regulator
MQQADGRAAWATVPVGLGRRTAHELVRDTLRRAILRGDLHGGARLVQADIAASLDVSTTPVREALRDLATEGLITLDRHRGGVVRELNWADMEEIAAIRAELEPLAMRLVVDRVTDADLDEGQRLVERMLDADDLAAWVELNAAFHSVVHDASASPRLASILRTLEDSSTIYVAQAQRWHPEIRRRAEAEHVALVEALRARDRARAVKLAGDHAVLTLEMLDPAERGEP